MTTVIPSLPQEDVVDIRVSCNWILSLEIVSRSPDASTVVS